MDQFATFILLIIPFTTKLICYFLVLQGAGSALMGRLGKFEQIVRGMKYVSTTKIDSIYRT